MTQIDEIFERIHEVQELIYEADELQDQIAKFKFELEKLFKQYFVGKDVLVGLPEDGHWYTVLDAVNIYATAPFIGLIAKHSNYGSTRYLRLTQISQERVSNADGTQTVSDFRIPIFEA